MGHLSLLWSLDIGDGWQVFSQRRTAALMLDFHGIPEETETGLNQNKRSSELVGNTAGSIGTIAREVLTQSAGFPDLLEKVKRVAKLISFSSLAVFGIAV